MVKILKNKIVKTRVPHKCYGCLVVFPSKSKMEYQAFPYKGSLKSIYLCGACSVKAIKYRFKFPYGLPYGWARKSKVVLNIVNFIQSLILFYNKGVMKIDKAQNCGW